MTNPLIPTPRVNKLGHVVTKHVRSGPAAASDASAIPAPRAASEAKKRTVKKLKPPTAKQLARVVGNPKPTVFDADERLTEVLGHCNGLAMPGPSDVTLFGLFAVVSPDNAMAFSSVGINDPQEAVSILKKNGLTDLLVDRRGMMDEAISMRVRPKSFLMLSKRYNIDDYQPDVFLTCAVLAGSQQTMPLNGNGTPDNETWLYDSIMREEVSYDDIVALGTTYLTKQSSGHRNVHQALIDRHNGSANFSLDSIKHVEKYGRTHGDFRNGLGLATKHGDEFLLSITGIDAALFIEREYSHESPEYRRALSSYHDEICRKGDDEHNYRRIDTIRDLYEHSVPASYVKALYSDGMDTRIIIDAYEGGVPEDYAVSMMANGLSMTSVIEAYEAEIGANVGDGWL